MNADVPADVLAGALAARVAHDLAGALGGITVTLGLLDDKSPQLREEAAGLIAAAVNELEARLAFCRAAYGLPAALASVGQVEALAQRLFAGARGKLTTKIDAESAPGVVGQVVLALAQLGAGALGGGGEALVSARRNGGWTCELDARGVRVRFAPESAAALRGEAPPSAAAGRWAPAAFLHALVARRGGEIHIDGAEQRLTVLVRLPAVD